MRSCSAPTTARRTSTVHVRLETPFARPRRRARDRVEPGRDGLPARRSAAPDARALAARLDGEESAETVLFLEGDEARSRGATARSCASRPADGLDTSGDEAVLGYPDGLERAWAALHNPNAGEVIVSAAPGSSSPTSPAVITSGGGSHGSLRARRLGGADADDRHRRAAASRSSTSRRPCSQHFGVAASRVRAGAHACRLTRRDGRSRMVDAQLRRPRRRRRARARRDGTRPARALRPGGAARPRLRRRRAADRRRPDDLAAVHGRADLRGARADRATSTCSTSARAPATRPRCSPSSRRRSTRSSASPSSPSARARTSRPPATTACSVHVGDGTRGLPERAPFDAIAVAAAAPELPQTLYEQLEPRGRLVVPVGRRGDAAARGRSSAARRARPSCAPCRAVSSRSWAKRGSEVLQSGRSGHDGGGMRERPETSCCALPVRLHGIQLGRPVDLLLDRDSSRAVGLDRPLRRRGAPFPAAADRCSRRRRRSRILLAARPARGATSSTSTALARSRSSALRGPPRRAATGASSELLQDVVVAEDGAAASRSIVARASASRSTPTLRFAPQRRSAA